MNTPRPVKTMALEKSMLNKLIMRGVELVRMVGIPGGAQRAIWHESKGFDVGDDWVRKTEGTKLMAVLGFDYVDASRAIISDVV